DLLGDGAVLRGVGPALAEFEGGGPGALGVGGGDGVGGEQHLDIACSALVQSGQRLPDAFDEGGDESGVVEELAHLVHLERLAQAGVLQGVGEVLPVLAAGGVGGVGAGGDGQQPGVAGLVGGVQRIAQVGVPVPVAPVDRQVQSAGGRFVGQGGAQAPVLPVGGADAVEVAIVGGDVLEPFVRDAAPGGDVTQERDDLVLSLRSSESGEQDGVVVGRLAHVLGSGRGCGGGGGHDGAGARGDGGRGCGFMAAGAVRGRGGGGHAVPSWPVQTAVTSAGSMRRPV